MLRVFYCLLLLSIIQKSDAQNTIGLPEIISYPKSTYQAGTQNWKVGQHSNGVMFFANNDGLLSFDGRLWRKYTLPNKTIARSVAVVDDRIYIGSQSELGYFAPDKNGSLVYTSLLKEIREKERNFADVWEIIPFQGKIFFRANKKVLLFNAGKFSIFDGIDWSFLGACDGKLFANEFEKGLLIFQDDKWVPFNGKNEMHPDVRITSFTRMSPGRILITTLKSGLFILHNNEIKRFSTPDLDIISGKNVYGSTFLDSGRIAIITNLAGCYIISTDGKIIQQISKLDGLLSNNIISVFQDKEKNLWLGLDNGINLITFDNAISRIFPDYQEQASGYAAYIWENRLYMGTAGGLFGADLHASGDLSLSKSRFNKIPGSDGQVWNLSVINNQLLMGHNLGFFHIQNGKAEMIDGTSGFWTFLPLEKILPSAVIATGTYNGINFYDFKNGKFVNPSIHTHFESARFFAIQGDTGWVAHPYKGLYKITLGNGVNPSHEVYQDRNKILSENNNYIFKAKERIILCNDKGIFEYNERKGDFEHSAYFEEIFGKLSVQYLREDAMGNIWFVSDKNPGVVSFVQNRPRITFISELSDKIMADGYEFIYPYDQKNIFIAGEEGFFHLNFEQYKSKKLPLPMIICEAKAVNGRDSILTGGYAFSNDRLEGAAQIPGLSHDWNSLQFRFAAPVFSRQSQIEFSYMLENFDKNWSAWSQKNEKEYTNLPNGEYTFMVKTRLKNGEVSPVFNYKFRIHPPWYKSIWAYLFYYVFASALLYVIYYFQKRKFAHQQARHEAEQEHLKYMHQLERDRDEKEIIRLQNEKLEAEIQLKNTELASARFDLLQSGERMTRVKEELVKLNKEDHHDKESKDYKKIIKMLGEEEIKRNWDEFAIQFDKVHNNFLIKMKSNFPDLTPGELKLCAYLRLNLTSKEIARIMNITTKSVELARYRLRKKLEIPSETGLFSFLLKAGE